MADFRTRLARAFARARSPTRHKASLRRNSLVLGTSALLVGALVQPAGAGSTTGIAEYTYDQCFGGFDAPTPTQLQDFATGLIGLSDPRCRDMAIDAATTNVSEETSSPASLANFATAAPETVEAGVVTAMAAAGEGVSQAAQLLGLPILSASWSVAEGAIWSAVLSSEDKISIATQKAQDDSLGWANYVIQSTQNDPLHCVWVPSPCMYPIFSDTYAVAATNGRDQMGIDDTSYFKWISDIEMWWDANGNGKGAADGGAYSNLYRATRQDNPGWRFWGTTQAHSLTPRNGWKLKKMTGFVSSDGLQRVEFSPITSGKYGDNGTINIQATFAKEGGGSGISAGRTWSVSDGTAGGALLKEGHFTFLEVKGGGTRYTKSTEGAETWKIPPGDSFSWRYHIEASLQK